MPNLLCDHEDLQLFLDGKITPTEESGWLDHIESCTQCQSRMETLAADGNWWKDAKTFLAADSGIAALSPRTPRSTESGGDTPQSGNEPEETGPEAFTLDFLAPTDEVDSLGRLGTYEVTGVIGRGGSGIVLKAFDRSLNRNVAIKVLSPHLATSGAARKRFAREAQAAAAVVHEHVIPIFAVASHQNLPYIVMQYFPGKSLQQRLDRDGSLELKEILRIGLQTARGLAAAHAQGLVHRDVKPANILLADGIERVSLSDFGLARAVDDARLTRTGWLAGTPEYMSPEQARGKAMDARSDLFSLGSVLYTACTGRVPFQSETSYGTLRLVTDEEPTPIRQLNPEIPDWLCRLIQKLMAKNAEDRFGSASEVADLLETCLAHVQQPDSTSLPTALLAKPQPAKSSNSGRIRTIVGTLLGFFGFLVAGMFLWQWTSPPDIAGWWTGEDWGKIQLKHLGSGEYEGTYSETVGKGPGQIQLKWSRIENRFNGTWREGDDRFGELSIRLVKEEIRGALTTDPKSKINPATPRLADLVWNKPDSQLTPSPKVNTPTKPSPRNSFLSRIQGDWLMTRVIDEGLMEVPIDKVGGRFWTIQGSTFTVDGISLQPAQLSIVEEGPPTRVDYLMTVLVRTPLIPSTQKEVKFSSLWEFKITPDGERLVIVSGKDGLRPSQTEPTKGFSYMELIRRPSDKQNNLKPIATQPTSSDPANPKAMDPAKNVNPIYPEPLMKTGLAQFQGEWIPVKQVDENLMEIGGSIKAVELWTIKGNVFTTGGDLTKPAQLDPFAQGPPGHIDFLRLGTPPTLLAKALSQSHRAPSLWSLDGNGKLRVLIGTNGKRPEKPVPTTGCLYFELIRQEKAPPTSGNGSTSQPPSQTTPPLANIPYLERFFRMASSEAPSSPKSVIPNEKEEILKKLQGTWIIDKQVVRMGKLERKQENPGDAWIIEGNTIKSLRSAGLVRTIEIKSSTNPIRIDWIPAKEDNQNRGGFNPSNNLIPTLWEQSGDQLKVVMAPNGKLPEKVESAPDCAYFELSRKRVSPKSPSKPTSPPPDKNGETEKEEILKHLQGNWVIEKQIILKDKGERIQEKAGDAWTIEGNTLRSWNRPDLHNTLEIKTARPQIRIDWVSPNRDPQNSAAGRASETLIPSLWERSGEKLKVILAPGGKLPEKIEPTLDCIYFELARKPKSETTQLGFPTRFQGKWKVSRMVGPDQKDGQLNLGETVTIEPGILRIGDQIKKAELVDTGSFLKGNLVSTVISPKDGSKNEVRIVSLWELTKNKIRFVNGVEIPTKVEPGIGCFYYELERIENEKPNANSPTLNRPASSEAPMVEVRKEKPGSEGTNLVFYRKKTDGVDRIVRSLPRHHYGFDQPRKTEQVVFQGAQFSVTWKWGNRLPLVPGPDAELLDLEVLKSGDPVSKSIHKQVYLVGHPLTIYQDDNFTLVLEPVNGFIPATKKVTEFPELVAMLDKVKKMESVSWDNHGVGLFRDADVIFCCQKKGLLRCDEYRDKKWLRSMVLNFPHSKILSLDSDQKVPRSEGTLDATSLHLQNLFVVFEDMANDRAVLLDQIRVKGKPCNLYRIQSDSPYQKTYQDRYLWVDPATQLPIVIRCTAKESLGVFTYRQFLWNLPLGDTHFLLDRTKEKLPAPIEKPKTEVAPPPIKTEVKDPKTTLKTPDKKTNTKP